MGNQRFSITPAIAAIDNDLPDSVFRTLSILGIYGDRAGWCWPSQSTIAELRGVSRQTINTHIKILVDMGYLNVYNRINPQTGANTSNKMQIKFDYDLTGDVKPGLDRGCKVIDLTGDVKPGLDNNAPDNDQLNTLFNGNGKEFPFDAEPDPSKAEELQAQLSGAFTTATGLYEPSSGSSRAVAWVRGLVELAKMEATPDEVAEAVERMDAEGYTYKSPESIITFLANGRKDKKQKVNPGVPVAKV